MTVVEAKEELVETLFQIFDRAMAIASEDLKARVKKHTLENDKRSELSTIYLETYTLANNADKLGMVSLEAMKKTGLLITEPEFTFENGNIYVGAYQRDGGKGGIKDLKPSNFAEHYKRAAIHILASCERALFHDPPKEKHYGDLGNRWQPVTLSEPESKEILLKSIGL